MDAILIGTGLRSNSNILQMWIQRDGGIISWPIAEEKNRLFPKGQKLYQKENGVRPINAFTSLGIVLIKLGCQKLR